MVKKRVAEKTSSLGNKLKMTTMRNKPSVLHEVLKEKEVGGSLRKIRKHGSIKFNANV